MKIYHYNANNQPAGASDADESPLEPGVYLIPGNATDIAPPAYDPATQTCTFGAGAWTVAAIPPPPAAPVPTAAEVQAQVNADAKAALAQIDAESVRAIREFVLAKFPGDPLLPAQPATHNTDAANQPAKIK